ncbi:PilZ domain-containing protein [Chitinibacter sp. SCUT-21]|uniref:PilZ domain-containing protein n=1 Tax=Chitinibacter sp. SCUT-21 TaxID=2970891 RepID=UPI0035A59A0D
MRYLMVLADFEQGHESIELAQAKQDLLLLWLAKSQTIDLPNTQLISVGMNQITWQGTQSLSEGEVGVINLCLSLQFPLLLSLKAKIASVDSSGNDTKCFVADLCAMSPQLQDHFEQTVFRYHRRAIQQSRQAAT